MCYVFIVLFYKLRTPAGADSFMQCDLSVTDTMLVWRDDHLAKPSDATDPGSTTGSRRSRLPGLYRPRDGHS